MSVRKRTWTTGKAETKEAWIVDYVDQEGDRHIETFERKKEADARHDQVKVNVRAGTHTAPNKSITVAEAAEAWIKQVEANGMKGHGPAERSTLRQYRQHINHIIPLLGRVKLAMLGPRAIEQFRDDLLAAMSRPLARKVLTSLKSIAPASPRGGYNGQQLSKI
jgi:integrase